MTKVELSESELRRDYYQLNMDQTEIAEKHDCHRMTVSRRMNKYDMERLPKLKTQKKNNGRKYYVSEDKSVAEYQLVAIADGADPHDVFGSAHIHHLNDCQHDNRPQNLCVLTPKEHGLVERGKFSVDKESGKIYRELELSQ